MNRERINSRIDNGIGWGRLLAYGVPGLPLTAMLLPLVVFLPPYYAALPGVGAAAVGAVLFGARIWDVVTDLGVGWASDRWRGRLGRRRPFILAGAPLLLLGTWLLFVPPEGATWVYLLVTALLAYLGWTMVSLPYQTWGAELSADYDERSRITAAREGFAVLGTMVAIMLPTAVQRATGSEAAGLESLFWFMLVALPLSLGLLFWKVDEPAAPQAAGLDLRAGMKLLAGNQPFRRLLLAYLANGAANGVPATLFLFFNLHVLEVSQEQAGIALIVYFLSAVAGLPLWLRLGRGRPKHRLWCASMVWAALVFAFATQLGAGDYGWYLLICVLAGSCLGIDQAVPASMQADVIDEDTAAGGGGRAGLYFGLWGMATKLSFALAVGLTYPLLEWAGFNASTDAQGESALQMLVFLYAGLPVLVKLAVVALVWRYPLDRARHAELRSRIIGA
ncbi:MFS transporter [Algiphilus aromaticivorans]|uniref:MFS transporter n=1 Tax=Algiphilus aromaticivorans TaxID=382454 RepID=UPI000694F32E|nr:MFS transporter [Algiphilus aromaticivorans]